MTEGKAIKLTKELVRRPASAFIECGNSYSPQSHRDTEKTKDRQLRRSGAASSRRSATEVREGTEGNAAYFSHRWDFRINWWGGPPGPRGTPSSRPCLKNQSAATAEKPTRGSAADEGVRPTICATARNREKHAALAFRPPFSIRDEFLRASSTAYWQ